MGVHPDVDMCTNPSVVISRAMLTEHQAGKACQLRQPRAVAQAAVGQPTVGRRAAVRQLERAASGGAGR